MNYLIAGLGNIGSEYENTRHNMGFVVLDAWVKASNTIFSTERYGDVVEVSVKGNKFFLLKPSTYMNLSGKAVRYWMQEKKIPAERTLVVCDDLNLPFGTVRMRKGGSDGGHNGLKNIIETIGTEEFPRIRLGIGNDFAKGAQVDFVLGPLNEEQLKQMEEISVKVIEGIKTFAAQGADRAMNVLNTKQSPKNETPQSAHSST